MISGAASGIHARHLYEHLGYSEACMIQDGSQKSIKIIKISAIKNIYCDDICFQNIHGC